MATNNYRRAALVLAASLAACQGSSATPTTDLPLAWVPLQVPFGDGGELTVGLRLQTTITVQGGAPLSASVDTGSAGLELLANLLPPATLAALPSTGAILEESFPESGIQATGYLANAMVGFGDAITDPIPVAVLQTLTCQAGSPCQAIDGGSLEPFLFNGAPAMLGLGMRNSAVGGFGNPIVQLAGQPPFVIEAPAAGSDAGSLRIAPPANEVAAYATAQLENTTAAALDNGAPPWNDLALPTCVTEGTGNRQFCGGALLDTGTPFVQINWSGISGFSELSPGTSVTVSVGSSANPIGNFGVTVGSPPQFGLDDFELAPALSDLGNLIVLGLPVFARYDVLFDQAHGKVGLRLHSTP